MDKKDTFNWLKSSSLKTETEGFIIAAQDQSLKTKNYITNIMKVESDPLCRFCDQYVETIDHLIAGCPILAKKEHLERHNKVAQYIHWQVCQYYKFSTTKEWYKHETPAVLDNQQATILWDFSIQTDRTIKANRPDIVIRDKTTKICTMLDVSIPADKNTSLKTFEKLSKYKDLEIEIEKSWKEKTKMLPIIIGALGVINKNSRNYIEEIPGNINIYVLQKVALLGSAHILRKALSMNTV